MKLCWNYFVKGNQQGPSVWFRFHKIDPCWSSCIINNGKEIPKTIMGRFAKGPQTWQWIRSKALSIKWLKEGKGSLFYFAMGQRAQSLLLCTVLTSGRKSHKTWSLASDTWPNLRCQR